MLGAFLDVAFAPVLKLPVLSSVAIISSLITAGITLINRKFTDVKASKDIKKKIDSERAKMLEAQKEEDKEKMDKHMKKMMDINSEYMKMMTKPMMISILVSAFLLIFIFPWLNAVYAGQLVGTFPAFLPLIGGKTISWIVWYIVCSLVVSIALRKVLGM